NMPGVRFLWSKVNILGEDPETKNVLIRYRVNGNEVKDDAFDLVVLSVGLTSSESSKELAKNLSIERNVYGFCESPSFSPIETSQPGIYVCGAFHAPMDIPDSVTMASGAASLAAQLLSDQRGTLIEEKEYPPERNIMGEPPRVGVFVCRCGTNIAKNVDVEELARYAEDLEYVSHAEEGLFICSVDSVGQMVETIQDKGLNRVVVAACTPKTHEPLFQDTLVEAGLNPFVFEFANIREHCSLVHMADRKTATLKAQDIIRMAVSKAVLLEPLPRLSYDMNRSGLVIGGGIAGMVSALALADQGFQVHLVEKTETLGGIARRIRHIVDGADVRTYLKDLIRKVEENTLIRVYKEAQVRDFSGYVGNFTTKVGMGSGEDFEEINHGVTIVATGAEEYKPTEYLYGKDPRVLTSLELEERLENDVEYFKDLNAVVMIQCIGLRENERPYCGRVCCTQSLKNALKLKEVNPDTDIYILFRDMRSYGFNEDYYMEASKAGVKFIRYDLDDKPDMEATQEEGREVLRVTVKDSTLDLRLMLDADLVVLAAGTVPASGNRPLSQLLKVPLNEDGFFMEAHMKLRPVDFATDGIFMCGLAHNPKFIDESIAQAQAAASRAATLLSQESISVSGTSARVDPMICTSCGICVEICPYSAPSFIEKGPFTGKAEVNPILCKGCGLCIASCRSGALDLSGFATGQVMAMINEI
ncbi:MAG: FAD-dependent oxidoreductase, partial [Deltaproteobacteria bacterium]|nr:FAD-dependent oxidoreductase [Deltaproteobacteria bacterium]